MGRRDTRRLLGKEKGRSWGLVMSDKEKKKNLRRRKEWRWGAAVDRLWWRKGLKKKERKKVWIGRRWDMRCNMWLKSRCLIVDWWMTYQLNILFLVVFLIFNILKNLLLRLRDMTMTQIVKTRTRDNHKCKKKKNLLSLFWFFDI